MIRWASVALGSIDSASTMDRGRENRGNAIVTQATRMHETSIDCQEIARERDAEEARKVKLVEEVVPALVQRGEHV